MLGEAIETFADFAARLGDENKARQVLANTNNKIALRVLDAETQEYIANGIPKIKANSMMDRYRRLGKDHGGRPHKLPIRYVAAGSHLRHPALGIRHHLPRPDITDVELDRQPLILAASVDGFYVREIRKMAFTSQSPIRHKIGIHAFKMVSLAMVAWLCLPIPMPIVAAPAVVCFVAVSLWLWVANLQKRL